MIEGMISDVVSYLFHCLIEFFALIFRAIWNSMQNNQVSDCGMQVDRYPVGGGCLNIATNYSSGYKSNTPECYQHLDSKYHADDNMFEFEEKIYFTKHNGLRSFACPCCGYENIFTVATAIEYINGYTGSCKFQDFDSDLYEYDRVKYYCLACKTPIALDIYITINEPYAHSEEDEEMEYEEEDY